MHFEGQQTIKASIETIWEFLMDPYRVAECAPGFQSMEVLSSEHFKPRVGVAVGPVKATFTLDVVLNDLRPPHHAAMIGHGVAAGSAVDMSSSMDLKAETETITAMTWSMNVDVSGKIASVGARLLEGTARKLTEKFFDCLRQKLEVRSTAPAT
jgi:carbon monoxide dehydrogenase subunit G